MAVAWHWLFAIRHVTGMKLSIQGKLAYAREELHPFGKLKLKKKEELQ